MNVESQVTEVTVYPDRARVTCRGEVELEVGLQQLLIAELPLSLQPDSVRVGGRGTAGVRILSVDVERRHYEATPAARVDELEQEIERAEDELRVLADRQAALAAQAQYLDGMRQATVQYAKGLSRGKTTVEDQAQLVRFLQEEDLAVRTAVRELDQEQRGVKRRLERLRRELKEWQSQRPRQRYQARVEVEVLSEGSFRPELSYVVGNAGWQPLYDLRLLEDEERRLELTMIAEVKQNTGQDWDGVALMLSTARPALNQRLPELDPWYIDIYRPAPPPAPKMQRARGPQAVMSAPAVEEQMDRMVMAAREEQVAEVSLANPKESGTTVQFEVPGQTTIPSDGSPHKTTAGHVSLVPQIDYLAVPKHTDAVYRRVTIHNESPGPWLPGGASLFAGDEYIGSTHIDFTPRGEEVELLLGVEERLTVKRELVKREVDKRFLRDRRQMRYGYEIELHNLLAETAVVELHDHIPVARHEEIKVKLEQVTPEPSEQSDLNLLEWRLSLAAGAEQTVSYHYLVEYPRSLEVVGLHD